MAKPLQKWTVFPHQPIDEISDALWRVDASVPGAPIPRVMHLVRLADRRLIVHNAICLGDAAMKAIEEWGTPSFLIVPGAGHRLDAKVFKDRYASMKVIAPPGAAQKIAEVVAPDAKTGDFGSDDVRYEILDGTAGGEGVLCVKRPTGTTLIFNDAVMNMQSLPGFGGAVMGLFGFTGPKPKVSGPTRFFLVKDKKALRSHLERLADTPGLARIDVAHGAAITEAPAEALREVAAGL
jgi:hypothetical protein